MNNKGKISNFIRVVIVILIIILIVLIAFFIFFNKNKNSNQNLNQVIVIENPLKGIVLENTQNGIINQTAIINQGIINFNENYINYLLIALGVSDLHKSSMSYGNPKIEIMLDDEVWNSELGDILNTKRGNSDDPDLRIRMKKQDAVIALLSTDIKKYIKDSVLSGNIQIEMVAGKVELFSKGYLDMYKDLTGSEVNI